MNVDLATLSSYSEAADLGPSMLAAPPSPQLVKQREALTVSQMLEALRLTTATSA